MLRACIRTRQARQHPLGTVQVQCHEDAVKGFGNELCTNDEQLSLIVRTYSAQKKIVRTYCTNYRPEETLWQSMQVQGSIGVPLDLCLMRLTSCLVVTMRLFVYCSTDDDDDDASGRYRVKHDKALG